MRIFEYFLTQVISLECGSNSILLTKSLFGENRISLDECPDEVKNLESGLYLIPYEFYGYTKFTLVFDSAEKPIINFYNAASTLNDIFHVSFTQDDWNKYLSNRYSIPMPNIMLKSFMVHWLSTTPAPFSHSDAFPPDFLEIFSWFPGMRLIIFLDSIFLLSLILPSSKIKRIYGYYERRLDKLNLSSATCYNTSDYRIASVISLFKNSMSDRKNIFFSRENIIKALRGYGFKDNECCSILDSYIVDYLTSYGDKLTFVWEDIPFLNLAENSDIDGILPKPNVNETYNSDNFPVGYASIFFSKKINVIAGPAGSGKTTLLANLTHRLDLLNHKYVLLSPTGAAGGRLEQVTGSPAYTIHQFMLIESKRINLNNLKFIIIDEASLLTPRLFSELLGSFPDTSYILVGDPNQINAISTVSVLTFLIYSKNVNYYKLGKVYRTQNNHDLLDFSQQITKVDDCKKFVDDIANRSISMFSKDAYNTALNNQLSFLSAPHNIVTSELQHRSVLDFICKLYFDFFNKYKGNVKIITPYRPGLIGVTNINNYMHYVYQEYFKKLDNFKSWIDTLNDKVNIQLCPGEPVICSKNNYKQWVFNGYEGKSCLVNGKLMIKFCNGKYVHCDNVAWTYSYAITSYSSQGHEYDATIVYINNQWNHLTLKDVYTTVTRGKKQVVFIYDQALTLTKSPPELNGFNEIGDKYLGDKKNRKSAKKTAANIYPKISDFYKVYVANPDRQGDLFDQT